MPSEFKSPEDIDLMELLHIDMGPLYLKIKAEANPVYGYIPLMASSSYGQIGALNAESFCERMFSCAGGVMDTSPTGGRAGRVVRMGQEWGSAVRRSERLAKAGSNMLISAVPPFGRLSGMRCWPALGLQTRALEPPFSAAEASTGHLSLHGHVERPCLARPAAWSTAQRRSDRLRLTNDEKPSRSRRGGHHLQCPGGGSAEKS